jgi:hypothetical protein
LAAYSLFDELFDFLEDLSSKDDNGSGAITDFCVL